MYIAVQIILGILVTLFLIYVAVEFRALQTRRKDTTQPTNKEQQFIAQDPFLLPSVSVLLPVYNEKLVVEKLINAVCALDYPRDLLEILVLDDSTDETGKIASDTLAFYRQKGINARYLRRDKRIGYKAGNLAFGLANANGEFIAIFDADCLPPADFLKHVMPYFKDKKIGFLQTKIAYSNAGNTLLTRFQATEAAHKEDVTEGFASGGFMASLTGSSCVWRRTCIEAIGGISQKTITEDVDMGYSAQLNSWAYVFPTHVVSWAELPESMAAFRVQRQRWARGLIHNAIIHAKKLFLTPMRFLVRVHAIALVFSPLLLALFYFLLLLAPFIALVTPNLGLFFNVTCLIFLFSACVWAWINTSVDSKPERKNSQWQDVGYTIGYVLLFFPLSLYYFSAIIQTLIKGKGEFYTTPKGCGRKKVSHPPINGILLGLEIFSFFYALAALLLGLEYFNFWVVLYAALALGGFSMALFFSFSDSRKKMVPQNHILITGASGSIGSALAQEYASPGLRLTLQGRDSDKLKAVAEKCISLGASVNIKVLDLENTENTRQWAKSLAESDLPELIIINAGQNTNIGPKGEGEPYPETISCVKVNLLAPIAILDGFLPAMRKRKHGQIAIISSLAAYYGLTATPTYCATKGALKNLGTSLRGWLGPEGIHVNLIFPGYVESPMCRAMPGPKPFIWKPKRAARKIRKGLEKDKPRISFPFPLNLGVWALSILPVTIAMPIARILGYGR